MTNTEFAQAYVSILTESERNVIVPTGTCLVREMSTDYSASDEDLLELEL